MILYLTESGLTNQNFQGELSNIDHQYLEKNIETFDFEKLNEENINNYISNIISNYKITKDTVFIINALNDTYGNDNSFGINILKHLRIRFKIKNRIVLISSSTSSFWLSKKPQDIIIHAPQTQYLYRNDIINNPKLFFKAITVTNYLENFNEFIPFIKADFKIEKFSHEFANKFGVYALDKLEKLKKGRKYEISEFSDEDVYEFDKASLCFDSPEIGGEDYNLIRFRTTKKILYIDDQAEIGWKNLLESIFSKKNIKIETYVPNEHKNLNDDLLTDCSNIKPDLVLLDYKLFEKKDGNKPVEEVSGYKTLVYLKEHFRYLPIVMFSATSKSETYKKLLKAGAFGLWSKPRIEFGFDANAIYNDLLKIVDEALNQYKYEDEKIALESDFLINTASQEELSQDLLNYIGYFDNVFTDTNCWMMQISHRAKLEDIAQLHKSLHLTALITKFLDESDTTSNHNRFKVIVDIQRELLVHQYGMNPDKTERELEINAITSSYGLNLVNRLLKQNEIFTYDFHKTNTSIGERFKFKYHLRNNQVWQKCLEKRNLLFDNIFDLTIYNDEDANDKIRRLNRKRFLYADDAFINILYNNIENQNIYRRKLINLFITDDVGCVDNIFKVFQEKYETLILDNIKTNNSIGIERIASGTIRGINSYGQEFEICFIKPLDFSNKIQELSN